jgi:hypothetical protein
MVEELSEEEKVVSVLAEVGWPLNLSPPAGADILGKGPEE